MRVRPFTHLIAALLLAAGALGLGSAARAQDEPPVPVPAPEPPPTEPAKPDGPEKPEEPAKPDEAEEPEVVEPEAAPPETPAVPGVERKVSVGPAGTVLVEGAVARIGTPAREISALVAGRPPEHQRLFLFESPVHWRALRPYYFMRYEVSNAQYLRFLQDFPATHDTAGGTLANLNEIATHFVKLTTDESKSKRQVVWRQVLESNRDALREALGAEKFDALAATPDGMRYEPLPRGLVLNFYSIRPPTHWPSMLPPADELNHPVRFVSYDDAERMAEWAGMSIPDEFQWEWAFRGPESPIYPWGNHFPGDASLANWGGKVVDKAFNPTTLPVDSRPEGASWCGAHHGVGNVAEWTSSWFENYPGNTHKDNYLGRWVKVIRGGGAGDQELLVLRAANRNFVGGPGEPPYPQNAFRWGGFRLAASLIPGRDQTGPVVRRAVANRRVKEEYLELERFQGASTRMWTEAGASVDNHVYVTGRSHCVALIPYRSLLWETGMEAMVQAWNRPSRFESAASLLRQTEDDNPLFALALLHTDIPLEKVWIRAPEDPNEKKRDRGRAKEPPTAQGKCPAGTYVLAVWHGRLALLSPEFEFVCFIEGGKATKSLDVKKFAPSDAPATTVSIDPSLDWGDFSLAIPLGGKGAQGDKKPVYVLAEFKLNFQLGMLEAAGKWLQASPDQIQAQDEAYRESLAQAAGLNSGEIEPPTKSKPDAPAPEEAPAASPEGEQESPGKGEAKPANAAPSGNGTDAAR